jgi:trehalose 6-phosphate phosphatase
VQDSSNLAPVDRFVEAVDASRTLVATDFDGTLSPIVSEPGAARPLPGVLDRLARLAKLVLATAVISGRGEADLRRLLPVPGLILLGDYGRPPASPGDAAQLRAFNAEAEATAARFEGVRVERKPGSTTVHFRANPAAADALLRELQARAHAHGLEARPGRLVVEVVPAGWDKSIALRRLVAELNPAGVVFSGDDRGDRGCFTYLSTLDRPHLVIGVASREAPAGLFDACDLVLDGPEANAQVLSRLAAGWGRRARGPGGRGSGG